MKMSSKRVVSLASVAAILASFAAMPASAVESNVYSVSYETLTAAVTTADGDVVPAGSVAVTVSIDENSGFDGNTLMLDVLDGYSAQTDTEGMLVLQKGNVLAQALISGAVSEDGNTICIATAAAESCSADGDLFTFYMTAMARSSSVGFVTVASTNAVNVDVVPASGNTNQDNGISTCGWPDPDMSTDLYTAWYYAAGDADDNSPDENDIRIDATDASYILQACNSVTTNELVVSQIDDANKTWKQYFPSANAAECPDANGNGVITTQDAADVLNYSSIVGAGNEYNGYVGTILIDFIMN